MAPALRRRNRRTAQARRDAARKAHGDSQHACKISILRDARQILLEKQSVDCFTNANLPALLDRLNVKSCVVYGVVTEICVKNAALGLLKSGRKVTLVTDAVRSLDDAKCAQFLQEFAAAGGEITTVQQVTGFSLAV